MKKVKNYTRSINVKLTEKEFQALKTIREDNNIPVSNLIRDSIHFYYAFYTKESVNP